MRRRDADRPRPSVPNPRAALLAATLRFVREARDCPGVTRIALIGSLATAKPIPKDADLLVAFDEDADLAPLAKAGRRLSGAAQSINLGADIFLCDRAGRYVGRVCRYAECRPRALCFARRCGWRNHLNDDLDELTLPASVTLAPPFTLWPQVERRAPAPDDVERLLTPLERDDAASA